MVKLLKGRDYSIWIIAIVNTAVVLTTFFQFYHQFTRAMYAENDRLVSSVTQQVASSVAPYLITQMTDVIDGECRKALQIRGIDGVFVYGNDDSLIASAGKKSEKLSQSAPVTLVSKKGEKKQLGTVTIYYNSDHETKVVKRNGIGLLILFAAAFSLINGVALLRNAREKKYIEILINAFGRAMPDNKGVTEEIRNLVANKLGGARTSNLLEALLEKKIDASLETAEKKQRIAGEELAQKNLIDFFAKFAHDLRTPTSHIGSLAREISRMIKEGNSTGANLTAERIVIATDALSDMYENSTDFSMIINGKANNSEVEFNPIDLIEAEVAKHYEQALTESKHLRVVIAHSVPTVCIGGEMPFRKSLINVLSNAIKYSNKGGEILLVARARSSRIVVDVYDQGVGIEKDAQATLFEMFQSSNKNTVIASSGLGLFIAKTNIASIGGDVKLMSSVVGKGSHFRITMPISKPTWKKIHCSMDEKEIWLAASPGRQRNYISRILGTRKDIEVIHLSSTVDVLKHSSVSQADALLLVADDQIASELIGKENLFASNVHKVLVSDRQDLNESPFWAEVWHSFSLARVKRLAIKDQNATFVPSKGRVLLVDDDELNRELLPNDLQYQIGLDASIIDTAASGQEAIEMMSGGEYAVVITDHQMPLMNGLDLAKYIKEQWRGVLVAVMTANASEHVKSEYAKIGVDIFISKPPKQDQLQRLMESINTKKGLKSLSRAEQSFSSWPFVERRNKTKTEDHLRGVYEANLHNWLKDLSIHINAEERESALQVTHQAIGSSSIAGASDWVQFFSYIDELIRNDDWAGARLQMQRSGVLI